jgi:hypothetical protein
LIKRLTFDGTGCYKARGLSGPAERSDALGFPLLWKEYA